MIEKSAHRWCIGFLASVLILLIAPAAARADQNTFTGSGVVGSGAGADHIAADPSNPYIVYAVFQPALYRSDDGGRTWTLLKGGFDTIHALLVHPAEPTTIYISASDGNGQSVVYKSTDRGQTFAKLFLSPLSFDYVLVLAGDPSDASTVYAGTVFGMFYKSSDGGATWATGQSLSGAVAQLVIDPSDRRNVYAGTEADFYYFTFGQFEKSTDSGTTFTSHSPGPFQTVTALAIDPHLPSKLYMGVDSAEYLRGLFTSNDGGTSWLPSGAGLPGAPVSGIVTDPNALAIVYAGTREGVFRSLDAGATWAPFGSRLGLSVNSLTMSGDGRFLHAGTDQGAFDLEIVRGPIDVAGGASGDSQLLLWIDNQLFFGSLDASGGWSGAPPSATSTTWTPTAIAREPDGSPRILWQCNDGRWGLQSFGPLVSESVVFPQGSVAPADIAAASDGQTWILFTGVTGQMFVVKTDSSGTPTFHQAYGPAAGWSAVAIADSSEGAWVLWRCTDGRAGLSLHDAGGVMLRSLQWPAGPGLAAEDITVGADGRARLLRASANGHMEISTVDAAGQLTAGQSYDNSGFAARRISAGSDGLTRVLWNAPDGSGSVWLFKADNTPSAKHDTPTDLSGSD